MTPQNTNTPFFSVIIPTLNEEKFLPRLLEDLSEQSTSNFEVIHIDGRSEDKTREKAQSFAGKLPAFTQIISQVRHVSHQRNLGGNTAKGQFLVFIDADTQLPNYFLEGLSFQLHKSPADIFTTWSVPDSKKVGDKAFISVINLALEISNLLESPAAIGVLMGCSQKAFKKIGGFKIETNYGEDEEFVKNGFKKHLSFRIYHQPRFVYSLRRFRTEGTLITLQQMAHKSLHALTGNGSFKPAGYSMGGHLFEHDDPNRTLLNSLDDFVKIITAKTISQKRQTQLKNFLKKLITLEQED